MGYFMFYKRTYTHTLMREIERRNRKLTSKCSGGTRTSPHIVTRSQKFLQYGMVLFFLKKTWLSSHFLKHNYVTKESFTTFFMPERCPTWVNIQARKSKKYWKSDKRYENKSHRLSRIVACEDRTRRALSQNSTALGRMVS